MISITLPLWILKHRNASDEVQPSISELNKPPFFFARIAINRYTLILSNEFFSLEPPLSPVNVKFGKCKSRLLRRVLEIIKLLWSLLPEIFAYIDEARTILLIYSIAWCRAMTDTNFRTAYKAQLKAQGYNLGKSLWRLFRAIYEGFLLKTIKTRKSVILVDRHRW